MNPPNPNDHADKAGLNLRADTGGCHAERLCELIQKRAYQIYEARGRQPGREAEDWLQAEAEIKHHLGI